MGQKIHPYGFRLGITKDWKSKWYADKSKYASTVLEDLKIREYLEKQFYEAGLQDIIIERSTNELAVTVKVSKPGVVIGKAGAGVEIAEKALKKLTSSKVKITAVQVKTPEIEAPLVGEFISRQLKRRVNYKKAIMSALTAAMDKGAKGIKIKISGLLSGGNTIARTEFYKRGSIPSQTLRADIDYAMVHCHLIYGAIGIKVWIYKGEVDL